MKILKRTQDSIVKEAAHGGAGARKVYASPEHLKSSHFEMMTRGFFAGGRDV